MFSAVKLRVACVEKKQNSQRQEDAGATAPKRLSGEEECARVCSTREGERRSDEEEEEGGSYVTL